VLLHLQQRVARLERVVKLADRYLRGGQDATLHARLLKEIRDAVVAGPAGADANVPLGLGGA